MSLSDTKTLISWFSFSLINYFNNLFIKFIKLIKMNFWTGVKGTLERIVYKLDHSVLQLSFHRGDLWPVTWKRNLPIISESFRSFCAWSELSMIPSSSHYLVFCYLLRAPDYSNSDNSNFSRFPFKVRVIGSRLHWLYSVFNMIKVRAMLGGRLRPFARSLNMLKKYSLKRFSWGFLLNCYFKWDFLN